MTFPTREELQRMPLRQAHMWAILRGLEGYDDADTSRPIELLRYLARRMDNHPAAHEMLAATGWIEPNINLADGLTVAELRAICTRAIAKDNPA